MDVVEPQFAPDHEHSEECRAFYAEWKRYHTVVQDMRGVFTRQQVLEAIHTRDMFERQLRAIGCSGEALRRLERDAEIEAHGRPLI